MEIFVFNFRFFLPRIFNAPQITIPASAFTQLSSAQADSSSKSAVIIGDGSSFVIPDVGVPVYSIRLNTAGVYDHFSAAVSYEDDNFSKTFLDAGSWDVRPSVSGSNTIHFITSGNCRDVKIAFSQIEGTDLRITSIAVNSECFRFCLPRFLLLFCALLLIMLIMHFKLWKKALDFRRGWQQMAVAAVLIASFGFALMAFKVNTSGPALSGDVQPAQQDSYQYLTQAFYNGRFDYVIDPPQSLQSLSNPYDNSQRSSDYMWDSIYYHGRYYSYFGIAPVVTLLLPVKWLTGCYLSTSYACLIFALIAIAAALSLYLKIIALWFKNINFLMFISGAAAICFSNIFWLIARPNFYELAEASAIAFLMLALNMLFRMLQGGSAVLRKLLLSGVFFGFMVASRPTFIFYIAAALPFLYKVIIKDTAALKTRILRLVCFFAPLGVFAFVLGAYNYLRFGSPFDFGIEYQLTVSDLRYNKITDFFQVINGFYQYYLQPLDFDLKFPFFHVVSKIPSSVASYYFNFPIAGIFNFPVMIVLPACFYIIKRRMRDNSLKKWFVAILLLCCAVITYLDITMAGVLMRYTLDIYPLLLICALILWFEIYGYFAQRGAGFPVTKLFAVIVAASIVITCFICIVGENNLFSQYYPGTYQYVSGIFEFWR